MLVDTHAHLQWISFDKDREEVINRARKSGVKCIVNIGYDIFLGLPIACGKPFYVSFAIEGVCHNHSCLKEAFEGF